MLSNAYSLAKFRFDTAENEPAKSLQNFAKIQNLLILPFRINIVVHRLLDAAAAVRALDQRPGRRLAPAAVRDVLLLRLLRISKIG